jgi:hypothetical protein
MSEGMDLLNQMKNMPGMGDMSKMFSQMGIPGLGKNTKVNMGAMESQLNKNMKAAKMRERMKAKAASNMNQAAASSAPANVEPVKPALSEEEIIKIFSTGEKVDRTPRGAKPSPNSTNNTNSNTNATNTNNKKKKSKK